MRAGPMACRLGPAGRRGSIMTRYYEINEGAARAAHNANSMREFKAGSETKAYRAQVDEAYALAEAKAQAMPEFEAKAYALADSYARKLAEWMNEGYRIDAMCPSVLISGAGNFPTAKKKRQNQARDRHASKHEQIAAIKERIRKLGTGGIQSGDPQAVEKLEAKLQRLEARQAAMKLANAHHRKHGTLEGFTFDDDALAKEAAENIGFYGGAPFPPYALSNNNANIRRTRSRLEQLKREKETPDKEREAMVNGEPCRVVENSGAMRLQLVFDGKPDEDTRAKLKANGFRWSRRNMAWQRQLTGNALRALAALEA